MWGLRVSWRASARVHMGFVSVGSIYGSMCYLHRLDVGCWCDVAFRRYGWMRKERVLNVTCVHSVT